MIYTNDFKVEDQLLLNYLGVNELIIKKGEYTFDYSQNPNGQLKLNISSKITNQDQEAGNLVFVGYNPTTKTQFEYTIQPVFINGVASQIEISHKKISAN